MAAKGSLLENWEILIMKIILLPEQATAISKAIAPAISKDKTKHNLQQIEISPVGQVENGIAKSVRFAATDGFRLHVVTLAPEENSAYEWDDAYLVSGAELVKALADAAKKDRNGIVKIDCAGHGAPAVMVTNSHKVTGMNQHVTCVDMSSATFPNIDPLLADSLNTETELPASYDARYLADMVKAAGALSEHVKVTAMNTRKCGRVESRNYDLWASFTGLLMPVRA